MLTILQTKAEIAEYGEAKLTQLTVYRQIRSAEETVAMKKTVRAVRKRLTKPERLMQMKGLMILKNGGKSLSVGLRCSYHFYCYKPHAFFHKQDFRIEADFQIVLSHAGHNFDEF